MTKVESGIETVVLQPTLISSLALDGENNYIALAASNTHKNGSESVTTTYRLRAWIDYELEASNFTKDNRYQYKFNVNINSKVNAIGNQNNAVVPLSNYSIKFINTYYDPDEEDFYKLPYAFVDYSDAIYCADNNGELIIENLEIGEEYTFTLDSGSRNLNVVSFGGNFCESNIVVSILKVDEDYLCRIFSYDSDYIFYEGYISELENGLEFDYNTGYLTIDLLWESYIPL